MKEDLKSVKSSLENEMMCFYYLKLYIESDDLVSYENFQKTFVKLDDKSKEKVCLHLVSELKEKSKVKKTKNKRLK